MCAHFGAAHWSNIDFHTKKKAEHFWCNEELYKPNFEKSRKYTAADTVTRQAM